jgi:hypothetical protein
MIQCHVPCCFVFFKELIQYVRCATQRKEFKMSAFWSCMLKEFTASEPEAIFLVILRTCTVFHLRSCNLRLTLGRAPLRIHIIGRERRTQVGTAMGRTSAQPQVNLSLWVSNSFNPHQNDQGRKGPCYCSKMS